MTEKLVISNIAPQCLSGYVEEIEEEVAVRAPWNLLEFYPSDCGTKAYAYTTSDGRTLYQPARDATAGHRKRCPFCSSSDAYKKAKLMFHRLYAYHWENLWSFVLTTPKSFVDPQRYNEEGYAENRKKDLIKLVKKYMDVAHPGVGYFVAFHHWRSQDPLGPPHYHVHVIALCATYEYIEGAGLVDKQLKPYLSKQDLADRREIWRGLLKNESSVDLHYRWISRYTRAWKDEEGKTVTRGGPRQIMHLLKYVYRAYIQDVSKFLLIEENCSCSMNRDNQYWLLWHNRAWSRRMNGYGTLSNSKRKHFIKEEIVNNRVEEMKEIESKIYDPVTGKQISTKGKLSVMPNSIMKKSQLVARMRIRYMDYSDTRGRFEVFLPIPTSCMRWCHYVDFRRKKKGVG